MKLQVTAEFLVVMGFILLFIVPVLLFIYQKNTEVLDEARAMKLKFAVNTLRTGMESAALVDGEIKMRLVVPAFSKLSVEDSGEVYIVNGLLDTGKGNSTFAAAVSKGNFKIDDTIIIENMNSTYDTEMLVWVKSRREAGEKKLNITIAQ